MPFLREDVVHETAKSDDMSAKLFDVFNKFLQWADIVGADTEFSKQDIPKIVDEFMAAYHTFKEIRKPRNTPSGAALRTRSATGADKVSCYSSNLYPLPVYACSGVFPENRWSS